MCRHAWECSVELGDLVIGQRNWRGLENWWRQISSDNHLRQNARELMLNESKLKVVWQMISVGVYIISLVAVAPIVWKVALVCYICKRSVLILSWSHDSFSSWFYSIYRLETCIVFLAAVPLGSSWLLWVRWVPLFFSLVLHSSSSPFPRLPSPFLAHFITFTAFDRPTHKGYWV